MGNTQLLLQGEETLPHGLLVQPDALLLLRCIKAPISDVSEALCKCRSLTTRPKKYVTAWQKTFYLHVQFLDNKASHGLQNLLLVTFIHTLEELLIAQNGMQGKIRQKMFLLGARNCCPGNSKHMLSSPPLFFFFFLALHWVCSALQESFQTSPKL